MRTLDLGQDTVLQVEQSPRSDSPYPVMFVRKVVERQRKIVIRRLGAPTFLGPDHLVIANEPLEMRSTFRRQSTHDPIYLRDRESARGAGELGS
jgi:hypothetical protein